MGRYLFRLPDIGEGVAEAEIVAWHVGAGDRIEEDHSLVDVMTDKATVDLTSPVEGVVTAVHGEIGTMMAVGAVLVELEVEGAGNADEGIRASDLASPPDPAPKPTVPVQETSAAATVRSGGAVLAPRAQGHAPLAAPATRRRAHELGIPLQYVPGTGPAGRITPEDLDGYLKGGMTGPARDGLHSARQGTKETRIIGLRRKIAEKMQEAKRRIPHFTYVEECDLTELEALRVDLNAHRTDEQPKLTLLPFFMRALARTLPEFPHINARYDDEAGVLHSFEAVHVGIATQTPNGLIVPVVRHAEARSLWDCARELGRVSAASRNGTATRDDLTGATITLTSLGPLGGIAATPVINHPEVAILGPNKLVERPIVRAGHVTVRTMMNLSSAFDHRIVDGYDAACFIQRLKRLIEHPSLIFMD